MTWNPKNQIISTAKFESNLIAYIKAHQADAIRWVTGGNDLKPFTFPDENLADKNKPNLPVLYVTDKAKQTGGEDLITLNWGISFEIVTGHANAGTLEGLTNKYVDALENLLTEIDRELFTGTNQVLVISNAPVVSSKVLEIGSNETETAFFQRFTMDAIYQISASAY